jgi:hypothetical protein
LCIHIPFFTTCDNSADIQAIKDFISSQNNAVLAQIDSFEQTNNVRMKQLVNNLGVSCRSVKPSQDFLFLFIFLFFFFLPFYLLFFYFYFIFYFIFIIFLSLSLSFLLVRGATGKHIANVDCATRIGDANRQTLWHRM